MREVELLRGMSHVSATNRISSTMLTSDSAPHGEQPNINHILDVVVKDGFLYANSYFPHLEYRSTSSNLFLELSTGGDLFTYITTRALGRMNELESRYCGFQLMLGLQYLHERTISHRGTNSYFSFCRLVNSMFTTRPQTGKHSLAHSRPLPPSHHR